jgi:hypothetical protein
MFADCDIGVCRVRAGSGKSYLSVNQVTYGLGHMKDDWPCPDGASDFVRRDQLRSTNQSRAFRGNFVMLEDPTRGAIGATTFGAQTQDDRGDHRHVKILLSSPNDADPEPAAPQRVAKRRKPKHLKLWEKRAAGLRTLFQFSATMYRLLQFAVRLQTQYPYAVAAAFMFPLIAGIVYEAVQKVSEASEEAGRVVHGAIQRVQEASEETERLRKAVNDLKAELASYQRVEGKLVEGKVEENQYDPEFGWPIITTTGGEQEVIPLYGVKKVEIINIEKQWIGGHTNLLSCKVVETSSNGLSLYRCLAANTFDLSEAMLLNGAATASLEAGQSYQDAQAQAMAAKRGIWSHKVSPHSAK